MNNKLINILVLIALGLFSGCDNPSDPNNDSTHLQNFIGTWVNEDEGTGVTRIVIRAESDTIFVHMWGACHPSDCDWGIETTNIDDANDDQLSLEWNLGFVIMTQVIYYLNDGRLKVVHHDHFIDDSGRPDMDFTWYFVNE